MSSGTSKAADAGQDHGTSPATVVVVSQAVGGKRAADPAANGNSTSNDPSATTEPPSKRQKQVADSSSAPAADPSRPWTKKDDHRLLSAVAHGISTATDICGAVAFGFDRTPEEVEARWSLLLAHGLDGVRALDTAAADTDADAIATDPHGPSQLAAPKPVRGRPTPLSFAEFERRLVSSETATSLNARPLAAAAAADMEDGMVAEVAILRSLERRVMADREHAWPSNALALLRGGCGTLRHYMTSPRIHLGRGGTVNGFQTLDIATLADGFNKAVADHHATLKLKADGEFYIVNVSVTGELWVNGVPILPGTGAVVCDQALVEVSETRFIFEVNAGLLTALRSELGPIPAAVATPQKSGNPATATKA